MARRPRPLAPGLLFHFIARGNQRQQIFFEPPSSEGQVLTLTIEIPQVNARHHLADWASSAGRQPDIGHAQGITVGIVPEWVRTFNGSSMAEH